MMARHPLPQQRIAGVLNRHQRHPARSLKPAGERMDGVVRLTVAPGLPRAESVVPRGQVQLVSQSAQRLARLGQTRNALRVAPALPAPRLARKCYFLDWFGDAFPDQSARGVRRLVPRSPAFTGVKFGWCEAIFPGGGDRWQ